MANEICAASLARKGELFGIYYNTLTSVDEEKYLQRHSLFPAKLCLN